MSRARKATKPVKARARGAAPQPPQKPVAAPAFCRRCGTPGPVGDDGFCEKCEQALEQACL